VAFLARRGGDAVGALLADRVHWTFDARERRASRSVIETGLRIPADIVLLAIGFSGPRLGGLAGDQLALTADNTLSTDAAMMTNREGVFACGDARRGQSIVVWAIGEGRDVARQIDIYLTGGSQLPPSLRTYYPPTEEFTP
jgi:glutamate synthase (NADPH/NADH) small chain